MIDVRTTNNSIDCNKPNNKGFSLVEVIVCVAILAIAAAPLLQSISMTAKVNGKAQRMQNATSIAEGIMEEIKGKSLDNLAKGLNGEDANHKPNVINISETETGFCDASVSAGTRASMASGAAGGGKAFLTGGAANVPYYVVYYPDQQSNSGDTYNVTATMRASTYQSGTDELTLDDDTTDDNVAGANIVKLPKIEEVDTLSQMVLSIQDFKRYDSAALDYFNQRKAEYNPAALTASIAKKDITIKKEDVAGSTDTIRVECNVKYVDTDNNSFIRSLYTGTYTKQLKEGSLTDYEDLNSNIYLFYKKTTPSSTAESILITDTSTIGSHKVYFVMQDDDSGNRITDIDNTVVKYTDNTTTLVLSSSSYNNGSETPTATKMDENGNLEAGGLKLVTNLGKNSSSEGRIYDKNAKVRILDVTVEVTKAGESEAVVTLKSTKQVNLVTATPTPP